MALIESSSNVWNGSYTRSTFCWFMTYCTIPLLLAAIQGWSGVAVTNCECCTLVINITPIKNIYRHITYTTSKHLYLSKHLYALSCCLVNVLGEKLYTSGYSISGTPHFSNVCLSNKRHKILTRQWMCNTTPAFVFGARSSHNSHWWHVLNTWSDVILHRPSAFASGSMRHNMINIHFTGNIDYRRSHLHLLAAIGSGCYTHGQP